MRRIGAYLVLAALAVIFSSPSPSAAFGLRIGPLHLDLPFLGHPSRFGHQRRIAVLAPAQSGGGIHDKAGVGAEPEPGVDSALFYPGLALPGLYAEIFWPAHSAPWPFGYDAMFRSAFAKSPLDQDARACQQPDRAATIMARIRTEIRPRSSQLRLLQKLGEAFGMTSGYLTKACAAAVPAQPVARLQLMQARLQGLSMALDLVRPPLQQFEQSLNASQRVRFAAMRSASSTGSTECGATPTVTEWSIKDIDQSVQPSEDQRDALSDLKLAFASAAGDLDAHCPKSLPPTPLARLEAIEARLDASWRAALSMQVALAKFESRLSDQQRTRFEAMDVAEAR